MPYVAPGRQRFDMTLPDEIAEQLRTRSERSKKDMRQVIEETIRLGLAQEEQIKITTTQGNVNADELAEKLRQLVRKDTEQIVKGQANRLASLMMRCILEGGIAWRLTFASLQRIVGIAPTKETDALAHKLLKDAEDHSHAALARKTSAEVEP